MDPVSVIKELGKRAPLLHIKDGPCEQGKPMTAVGKGKMDFPPILKVANFAEWLIVELDSCATDMLEAVKESLTYLKK
jgi:sugar phosphate isomerase/epimerase